MITDDGLAIAAHRRSGRNGRFFNPGVPPQRFAAFFRWMLRRQRGPWRKHIPSTFGPAPRPRVDDGEVVVTFVNHATLLLQIGALNFLTDPVWSERVSPLSFVGPKRHRAPGIRFEDLPPIDVIVLSHNHYDHLDVPTLRRLLERGQPQVFCPLGVAGLLRSIGFTQVVELDWGQSTAWRGFAMHCVPAQHFSARTPFDRNRTLWCGWVIERDGQQYYFAGDTGYGNHFAWIAERFPQMQLALLPIGAYAPEWFMGSIHMTPEEALRAHRLLGAKTSVATHFGTFSLADDGEREPVERLQAALGAEQLAGLPANPFFVLEEGASITLPALEATSQG